MENVFQVICGVGAVVLGLCALAGVFVPSWRVRWRGSGVLRGATTNLGLFLVFCPMGLLLALTDHRNPGILAAIGLPILPGAALVLIGNLLDFRRPKYATPTKRRVSRKDLNQS